MKSSINQWLICCPEKSIIYIHFNTENRENIKILFFYDQNCIPERTMDKEKSPLFTVAQYYKFRLRCVSYVVHPIKNRA